MSNYFNKICNILLNILITCVVIISLISVYNFIQTKIQKKDYSNVLGHTMFKVSTGSMSETIEAGDIIFVKILTDEDKDLLNVQDIISFKQDNGIITHRIIQINDNTIITKGDANNTNDEPIQKADIIGKVEKIIPNVSIWEKTFSTPKVYISIVVTLVLFGLAISYNEKDSSGKVSKDSNNKI